MTTAPRSAERFTARAPRASVRAALALLAALAVAVPAHAQFFAFGQNKIQYRHLDWRILRGPHVDLYYYPAAAELAAAALEYAEASYDTLSVLFGHHVAARIPLIVYASHADFEQTNILPFTPPEGLLGATDFAKRRVAMPFRGNFAEFRHTLRHELVHVFQLDLMSENYVQIPRGGRVQPPLWWTEGLAELWSGGEDARDEMVLRDLTLSGRLPRLQDLTYVTSGIVYPLGGRIHRWLADTYGDWRVALFYQELHRYDTFEDALRGVYGRSIEQLDAEFQLAMRRAYYPGVDSLAPLPVLARELAELAIKPAYVPDSAGGSVAYMSPADGYVTIYRRGLDSSRSRVVVASGRSEGVEAFHGFYSRLDASRPGLLLFSTRYRDRDAVVVWDLDRRRIVGRYQFDSLVSILSPAWMPDGRSVVFSGLSESGVSDLYRVTLPDGDLQPLTRDAYQDLDPSPSPDGRRLVFASDRAGNGIRGAANLYLLDLETLEITALTRGDWVDESPVWADDGRIYFASDRDGVLNVFSVDTLGNGHRETSAWTGAFDPAPLPDGGLLVGGFHDLSWNVYRYPRDTVAQRETFALAPATDSTTWTWRTGVDTTSVEVAADEPYQRRLTLDFAAGDVVWVPGFGGAQGAAFVMTDLLGDHALFGSIGSFQGRRLGSLLSNINANLIYLNRTRRVNWGVGAFRARGRAFEGDLVTSYEETTVGVMGLLRYPLSRFNRLEGSLVVERSDRVDFTLPVDEPRRVGWIASNFVSFVRDNSLWMPSGPIDGMRLQLTAGIASDFSNSRFDNFLVAADLRRYFRLSRRSAWAVRGLGYYSSGDRPRRINLGGTLGLRGYPNFGYILGTRAFMVNQEIRFPLLNHLTFGTPIGDIRFPEIQGALFFDVGQAAFREGDGRGTLGSYGASFRLALAPLAVLRLDTGWRFSQDDPGYSLSPKQRNKGFVTFFFGYNY